MVICIDVPSIIEISIMESSMKISSRHLTNGTTYTITSPVLFETGVSYGSLLLPVQNHTLNLTYTCLDRTATFSIGKSL